MTISDIDTSKIQAVIFDFDGTLYNKKGIGRRLVKADFRNAFILLTERMVRTMLIGVHFADPNDFYHTLFREIAKKYHCSYIHAHDWFISIYMPLYAKVLKQYYHVEPWVIPLIKELREKGIKTAVLSDYAYVEEKLEALNIPLDLFDIVTSAPLIGGLKPCKQTGENILKMLDVKAENTLMVGDRPMTDGRLAKFCGMHFFLV